MTPRAASVVLLAVVALGACNSGPADVEADPVIEVPSETPSASPETPVDPYAVRDALVDAIADAGVVRVSVSGSPAEVTLDLVYDPDRERFARRFTWREAGETREVLQLAGGRVCANRAAAQAVQALGNNVQGSIVASDEPYSCSTSATTIGSFVIHGYGLRDPVARLDGLIGTVNGSDLGEEAGSDGTVARHVWLGARETTSGMRTVSTTYDAWLDEDGRPLRMEFTGLDDDGSTHIATFDYDAAPRIELPPAGERGEFTFAPGSGVPGFGGYLLGQYCPDYPEEPCPPETAGQ